MKIKLPRLNDQQLQELAKVFIDIGKAIFLGTIGAFFIPSLTGFKIPLSTLIFGIIVALTFIIVGLILLSERHKK